MTEKLKKIEELKKKEQFEQALNLISEAIKEHPDNIELLLLEGKILKQLQKFPDAINVFQKILKLDPQHQEALNLKKMTQDILRFEQLDIYASTNLTNDPWLDD
jgi:tetratricopeptide (TPR) repeat protein